MVRVLFVCLGNICRSPMAEGVFQQMVDDAGLSDKISVDSAGTSSYHTGETAHRGTRDVLSRNGIAYKGRARQFTSADYDKFDYILAMDGSNFSNIESRMPTSANASVSLFLDYAPQLDINEVPDPYYDGNFDEVYQMIYAASEGLLDSIRKTHNL